MLSATPTKKLSVPSNRELKAPSLVVQSRMDSQNSPDQERQKSYNELKRFHFIIYIRICVVIAYGITLKIIALFLHKKN